MDDHTRVRASATNTQPTLATASSSPPRAGPRNDPMLSIAVDDTFAAVSSSGDSASCGSRAAWAGRKVLDATAMKPART